MDNIICFNDLIAISGVNYFNKIAFRANQAMKVFGLLEEESLC